MALEPTLIYHFLRLEPIIFPPIKWKQWQHIPVRISLQIPCNNPCKEFSPCWHRKPWQAPLSMAFLAQERTLDDKALWKGALVYLVSSLLYLFLPSLPKSLTHLCRPRGDLGLTRIFLSPEFSLHYLNVSLWNKLWTYVRNETYVSLLAHPFYLLI